MEDFLKLLLEGFMPVVVSIVLAVVAKYGTKFIQLGSEYIQGLTDSQEVDKFVSTLETLILSAYQTIIKDVKENYKKNPTAPLKEQLEQAKRNAKVVVTQLASEALKDAPELVKRFIGNRLDQYIESSLVIVKKKLKVAENNANPLGTSV